ncbi:hypothetical protein [Sulfuricurvum sp.]|uniref:hypothetical protein n=1 Tax=Sulfuricurvum sp. TaxID=2025608 RepID=UPI003BB0653C
MESPELITFQKYAAKHRISIHSVIKKTMNGELKTVVREENGKEVTYIALPSSAEVKQTTSKPSTEDTVEIDYKKEYEALHKEYLILKTKYEKLLGA